MLKTHLLIVLERIFKVITSECEHISCIACPLYMKNITLIIFINLNIASKEYEIVHLSHPEMPGRLSSPYEMSNIRHLN